MIHETAVTMMAEISHLDDCNVIKWEEPPYESHLIINLDISKPLFQPHARFTKSEHFNNKLILSIFFSLSFTPLSSSTVIHKILPSHTHVQKPSFDEKIFSNGWLIKPFRVIIHA